MFLEEHEAAQADFQQMRYLQRRGVPLLVYSKVVRELGCAQQVSASPSVRVAWSVTWRVCVSRGQVA